MDEKKPANTKMSKRESPPVPPVRPSNDECCHSGCSPCIFDLYEEEVERYRAELSAWEAKTVKKKKDISRAESASS